MKLIEIRNNLIKLSYEENERPTLGQFIALTGVEKSYVAQYVNLKADNINNFAVAKLMFSFNADGVVSEYDGSAPSINSNIVELPANELLDLLPVDTALKIGQISGCNDELNVDISIFEHNFTVFCETDYEKTTVISNCVRQLFRMKEKSVILDCDDLFEEYPRITLSKDFKLPLNSSFIDFIFEHDLKNVDAATKAVIQDIFYAVQQYIRTLDDEFLPIESFIDVVTAQYKETQMPELALLKNKLLKYNDAGIFANEPDEYKQLEQRLKEKNCIVINIKEANGDLQREIINYVHKIIETFDKYVYYFVPLTDDNSDKKLVKRLINHSHVFTTFFASHLYKYASELKSHAQNILFFAPQTMQNDFAAYNTFLNKLNQSEGVIYGNLTQGIPLIITLEDLELDLTKDDVFGDRQRFVPAIEEDLLSSDDIYAINNLQEAPTAAPVQELPTQEALEIQNKENYFDEISDEDIEEFDSGEAIQEKKSGISEKKIHDEVISAAIKEKTEKKEPQIENILADAEEENGVEAETFEHEQKQVEEFVDTTEETSQEVIEESVEDDDLSFMNDFHSENEISEQQEEVEDFPQDDYTSEQLTEDDLDLIENSGQIQSGDEVTDDFPDVDENEEYTSPVVPVYDTEDGEEITDKNIGFKSGDKVSHPRYGNGTVEKIIKYGNKTLCSIDFENVGRRLLDPSISDFEKI